VMLDASEGVTEQQQRNRRKVLVFSYYADTRRNLLFRVDCDPATGLPQAVIPVGNSPIDIAVGPKALWVTSDCDGTVSRIDPTTKIGPPVESVMVWRCGPK
jgi:DNA-binding beta-propeller fold protein YncE